MRDPEIPNLEPPETDGLPPVDVLFQQAIERRATLDRLREAQREARREGDTDRGREATLIARRLLARLEWRDVALVALILEQECECGARPHFWFEGEFIERRHVRDKSARWQVLKEPAEFYGNLPKRVEYRTSRVKMCPSCLREKGYS